MVEQHDIDISASMTPAPTSMKNFDASPDLGAMQPYNQG
jgi:hypothetical protein